MLPACPICLAPAHKKILGRACDCEGHVLRVGFLPLCWYFAGEDEEKFVFSRSQVYSCFLSWLLDFIHNSEVFANCKVIKEFTHLFVLKSYGFYWDFILGRVLRYELGLCFFVGGEYVWRF